MERGKGGASALGGVLLRLAAVAGLYFLGAWLGLQLAFENRNVTAVWPPTGVAVAALLLWGPRMWPAIAIGAFAANLANGAVPPMAAAIAVGNTAAPLVATLLLRALGFHLSLDRVHDVILLFLVGGGSMTVSATIGTGALAANGALGGEPFLSVWQLWWIGDGFGVVLFTPFLLMLARPIRPDPVRQRPFEALALVAVSGAVTFATFSIERPIAFLVAVPIVWAALRFEQSGTSFVVVVVSLIAIAKTVSGDGQFSFMDPNDNIESLQIFNGVVGFASLVLAAVMHERTQAQRALRRSEERFRQAFDQATDLMCIYDAHGRLTYVNEATERVTGYSRYRLLTMSFTELVAPESVQTVRRTIERQRRGDMDTATYELEIVGTSGHRATLEVTSTPIETDGARSSFQLVGRDVTTRRAAEDQLRRRSLADDLTGLPNRTLFRERLDYALSIARRDGTKVALVILDIDNFRDVNDAVGHENGDAVLRQFATRLQSTFREPDTVARFGGDDFAILAPSLTPGREADVIVEQLRSQLDPPVDVEGRSVILTASAGLAIYPDHADDAAQLIRRADLAMHESKRTGGARTSVFHPDLDSLGMRRFAVEDELRAALEEGAFALHYQPKIDVLTMRTVGVECLLRWKHERLGDVAPSEFIPIAVAADLMDGITNWVLGRAIAQCAMWNGAGLDIDVSVNLAPTDLHAGTTEAIRALLDEHQLAPERLTIEVSERNVSDHASHRILEQLSALGVRLSIDDFGTGTSSMVHMSRLPLAELKVDRSFVSDATVSNKDHAVIRSMVELAHNLGLVAIAEGVETREAWTLVESLGCDQVQGFLVCPPVPSDELESWLRTPAWSTRVR